MENEEMKKSPNSHSVKDETQSTESEGGNTENHDHTTNQNSNAEITESSLNEANANQQVKIKTPSTRDKSNHNEVDELTDKLGNLTIKVTAEVESNSKNQIIQGNLSVVIDLDDGDEENNNGNENDKSETKQEPNENKNSQNDFNAIEKEDLPNNQNDNENSEPIKQILKKPKSVKPRKILRRMPKAPEKNAPIEHEVYLSLEEAKNGCTKTIEIERIFQGYGDHKIKDKKEFPLSIAPGIDKEFRITVEGEGNKSLLDGKLQGDVVFIVKPTFKQIDQYDIEYTARLSSPPNDDGVYKVEIPTLDNDPITLEKNADSITEETIETITGRGLPFPDYVDGKTHGNLLIRFEILHPIKPKTEINDKQNDQSSSGQVKKIEIKLTLKEIFKGCTKQMEISRKRIDSDRTEYDDEKIFNIEIKPGTKGGTEILFPKEGDQLDDVTFVDIAFVVTDIPNETFERKGSDITYKAKISHKQLAEKDEIEIPTLEGNKNKIQLDENIAQNLEKRFYGKGLPYPGDTRSRGSLFVKFEIVSDEEFLKIKSQKNKKANLIDKVKTVENYPKLDNQLPPNHYYLTLTLEELYFGCKKFPKIKRKINKGNVEHTSEVPLELWVKPGSIKGTQMVQYQEGDRKFGMIPADVVFTVAVEEHSIFKIEDFNLVYLANITYQESKRGCDLQIPAIDHDLIPISVDGPITPQTEKLIPGFGLPILDSKNGEHGDIIVRFNIISTQQDPAKKFDLQLTLTEISKGATKKMKIQKQVFDSNGIQKNIEKRFTINVKPGTEAGTEFKFPREGSQKHGCIPADIVFIARDKPHSVFERNKADIHYKLKLYKSELSVGQEFAIPTLDSNETMPLYVNESIKAASQKRFPNCGLPYQRDPNLRGDIVVNFIILPDQKDPEIVHEIFLTLENFFNGFKKLIKINRKKLGPNGEEQYEDRTMEIDIEPGTLPGKRYRSKNLGDEGIGIIPADIVFVVRDKPHPIFKRNGSDIEYTTYVTKEESKYRLKLEIPTLDINETKPLIWELSMYYSYVYYKTFYHKGLFGKYGNPTIRGDFIARYEVVNDDQKVPTMDEEVLISLEDVLYGCNKPVEYSRLIVGLEGSEIHEKINVTLDIKSGIEAGRAIIYYRLGNIVPGHSPGDVRFVFVDEPHDVFQRFGPDLLYIAKYTSSEAAKLKYIKVPTLENEPQFLTIEKITKDSVMEIPNKGLPFFENSRKRGKIIVNFEIIDDEPTTTVAEEIPENYVKIDDQPENDNNSSTSVCQNNDRDNKIAVEITLLEVLSGCDRCLTFERKTVDQAGNVSYKNKAFLWSIKPGTKEGKEFKIKKKGHQYYGKKQENVIYVLKYAKHKYFKRVDSNLEYTANITYEQSVSGNLQLKIPTLVDDEFCPLIMIEPIDKNYVRTLKGYGLPLHENSKKCGDIIVKFKIEENNNTNEQPSNLSNAIKLEISLEEFLNGNNRTEHLCISTINQSDGKVIKTNRSFPIEIKPGMQAGETFAFPKQGNESFSGIEDVVYVIHDKPHEIFKRNSTDIEYTAKLNSNQISQGAQIQIPTLENEFLPFTINESFDINQVISIPDRGLPFSEEPSKRGQLLIRFENNDITKGDNRNFIGDEAAPEKHQFPHEILKEFALELTLIEILHGCSKEMTIERTVIDSEPGKRKVELKTFNIPIKAGTPTGEKIIYKGEGDQFDPNQKPGDVVFVVCDKKYTFFERIGVDIKHIQILTSTQAKQAKKGTEFSIPTLESSIEILKINDKIKNGKIFRLKNKGLPHPGNSTKRGDIIVQFNVLDDENQPYEFTSTNL